MRAVELDISCPHLSLATPGEIDASIAKIRKEI
jgi:hypothetical protein